MQRTRSGGVWGDEGKIAPVFGLGNHMDGNDSFINQQNGIKKKIKLFHDNLKVFHKNHLLIKNHFL